MYQEVHSYGGTRKYIHVGQLVLTEHIQTSRPIKISLLKEDAHLTIWCGRGCSESTSSLVIWCFWWAGEILWTGSPLITIWGGSNLKVSGLLPTYLKVSAKSPPFHIGILVAFVGLFKCDVKLVKKNLKVSGLPLKVSAKAPPLSYRLGCSSNPTHLWSPAILI